MMKKRVFCLVHDCTVLCYIFEYIFIVKMAKRCTSPVFTFNTQNMTNHSTRSGRMFGLILHAESKHRTFASLCYLYNIDIAAVQVPCLM